MFDGLTNKELTQQIEGRRTATKKLPFLLVKENVLFPPTLNLEQTSSEATAQYKAQNLQGECFLDLTCGFGIDAFFLSEKFKEVTLVEENEELLSKVKHNWQVLERKATFINGSAEAFLKATTAHYNLIYLDPDRRDALKQKKFLLEDLSPNILELQSVLLQKADKVLTKLSPMIDISYLLHTLPKITHIHLVALRNEVKEVLVVQEAKTEIETQVTQHFEVEKLDVNTHLYTSEQLKKPFAGRVLEVTPINPKELKKGSKYCILSKNYPLSVAEIKKKYHIVEGGNEYLIFTRSVEGLVVLLGKVIE